MDRDLIEASKAGNINKLYELIDCEDTPLHVAVSAGQTCFAMEVMNLQPSLARKLNKEGLSPMHLALSTENSELVLLLLRADQELVRVKGKGGITPLHYATQRRNIHLLAIFLSACPRSIEDVTVQSETVLHMAVKNNMIEALEVLVGWLQRVCHEDVYSWNKNFPNWRDKNGDTVLDIAVSNKQIEAIQLLAEINAKNSKGLTALATLQDQTKMGRRVIRQMLRKTRVSKTSLPKSTKTLANYLRSNIKFDERMAVSITRQRMQISEDLRNALLVVAGLIVAVTFQAVFSPPGSVRQENDNPTIVINGTSINTTANGGSSPSKDAGKSVMSSGAFMVFFTFNSSVLCTVVGIVALLFLDDLFGINLIQMLVYLLFCYALSIYVISPGVGIADSNLEILCLFICILILVIAFYARGKGKIQQICYDANNCPKQAAGDEGQESGAETTSNDDSGAQSLTSA